MELQKILTWVLQFFQLGDVRRSRALAEIAWGLMKSGVVSFAAIGRGMEGKAKPSSRIARVFRFCHNKAIDPAAVQAALVNALVGRAVLNVGRFAQVVAVSFDWHSYDNGDISGLRVNLVTGSRALPLLWYEVKKKDLGGRQSDIEHQALRDLISYRPPGVRWLVLLDSGFHSAEMVPLLEEAGFYIMRQSVRMKVHGPEHCWHSIRDLTVRLGQVIEYGWLYWTLEKPTKVRLVATRLYRGKQAKRGRRSSNRHYKYTDPGLCVVATSLPIEEVDCVQVIRLYARRFEIEHNFRDLKNATYGMDMEHVHLEQDVVYSRLMCIVAVAEALLWLNGAEAEARGLRFNYTTCRPRSGRRVHSLRKVGGFCIGEFSCSISRLVRTHLRQAILNAPDVVGHSWKDPKRALELKGLAETKSALGELPRKCRRRFKGEGLESCCTNKWQVRPRQTPAQNQHPERKVA